jgi:hypothetical protein
VQGSRRFATTAQIRHPYTAHVRPASKERRRLARDRVNGEPSLGAVAWVRPCSSRRTGGYSINYPGEGGSHVREELDENLGGVRDPAELSPPLQVVLWACVVIELLILASVLWQVGVALSGI